MFDLPRSFDPFRELDAIASEFGRVLFSDGSPFRRFHADTSPAMNVWENEDGVVVKADLPGMQADSLDVSVNGDALTIAGAFAAEPTTEDGAKFHRRERSNGDFNRTVQLPYEVDGDSATATYADGVLTVQLSRPENLKPKKITVQAV